MFHLNGIYHYKFSFKIWTVLRNLHEIERLSCGYLHPGKLVDMMKFLDFAVAGLSSCPNEPDLTDFEISKIWKIFGLSRSHRN